MNKPWWFPRNSTQRRKVAEVVTVTALAFLVALVLLVALILLVGAVV